MTNEEQVLWDYVEQESNDLLLKVAHNVAVDGFDQAPGGPSMVALKVMSAAIVKILAIETERNGNYDLATAYMDMVPLQIELIKIYTFKALERSIK